MGVITVRFIGICCFVEGHNESLFLKRAILPANMHSAHHHRATQMHIPYVEIRADDLPRKVPVRPSKTFKRGPKGTVPRSFHRFDLDGERVSIRNVVSGNGGLTVLPTFQERVPRMTLVCPGCPPAPRPECFALAPPKDIVAAYFDIHGGYLSAGPPEEEVTTFEEGSKWPARRLAQWAQLEVSYQGDRAEILIEKFDGSSSRVIPLAPDVADFTIGNQPEGDIEQTSPASLDRRDHFEMYYGLGVGLPAKRPKPAKAKGGVRECSPASWP